MDEKNHTIKAEEIDTKQIQRETNGRISRKPADKNIILNYYCFLPNSTIKARNGAKNQATISQTESTDKLDSLKFLIPQTSPRPQLIFPNDAFVKINSTRPFVDANKNHKTSLKSCKQW